jgi:hypothetical protein
VALAVAAALVVPSLALADDGGTQSPAAKPAGLRAGAVARRIERRLDRRYRVFSHHCLVPNAPDRCSTVAGKLVTSLDRLRGRLEKLKAAIAQKCGAAGAPARCANAATAVARIDQLLGKVASDRNAVTAAFPNAGATTS